MRRIRSYPVKTKKIKKLLIDCDLRMVDLARQIGESRIIISHIIYGRRFVPRIRKKIARALGVSLEEIFPSEERDAA